MCTFVVTGCVVSLPISSPAQEIIHALTGTVSSINNLTKTITVFQDNGSQDVFQELTSHKTSVAFDKKIAEESTAADTFNSQGAYVIVFYFQHGDDRTAVALKSLGSGPFNSTEGTVTGVDTHAHSFTVQDKSGAALTFKMGEKAVAEVDTGVIDGPKFRAQKGDHVRVVSTNVDGSPTALFVRDL
jgi:hypothetical protein